MSYTTATCGRSQLGTLRKPRAIAVPLGLAASLLVYIGSPGASFTRVAAAISFDWASQAASWKAVFVAIVFELPKRDPASCQQRRLQFVQSCHADSTIIHTGFLDGRWTSR
jgi:hypothetical protein